MITTLPLTYERYVACIHAGDPAPPGREWFERIYNFPGSVAWAFVDTKGQVLAVAGIMAMPIAQYGIPYLYLVDHVGPPLVSIVKKARKLLREFGPKFGRMKHSVEAIKLDEETERLIALFGFYRDTRKPFYRMPPGKFISFEINFGYGAH